MAGGRSCGDRVRDEAEGAAGGEAQRGVGGRGQDVVPEAALEVPEDDVPSAPKCGGLAKFSQDEIKTTPAANVSYSSPDGSLLHALLRASKVHVLSLNEKNCFSYNNNQLLRTRISNLGLFGSSLQAGARKKEKRSR